jgi:hypothetical protein
MMGLTRVKVGVRFMIGVRVRVRVRVNEPNLLPFLTP